RRRATWWSTAPPPTFSAAPPTRGPRLTSREGSAETRFNASAGAALLVRQPLQVLKFGMPLRGSQYRLLAPVRATAVPGGSALVLIDGFLSHSLPRQCLILIENRQLRPERFRQA